MYRGKSKKKKKKIEKMKKKSSSRPFLAHPAGGQKTTFYLRMALCAVLECLIFSLQYQVLLLVFIIESIITVNALPVLIKVKTMENNKVNVSDNVIT